MVRGDIRRILIILAVTCSANAQWSMLESHTTAGLRGIHNVGSGIAWASGTQGVILRTTDDGKTWQRCSTPPGGENLDFRGVQGFDGNTAVVMSSGKGDLSRIYKTTDGCGNWKLVFTNPDADGFFDAIRAGPSGGVVVGDPVEGKFAVFTAAKGAIEWKRSPAAPSALPGEALFAASNSSIDAAPPHLTAFVTGGRSGAALISRSRTPLPLPASESSGAFSLAARPGSHSQEWMIVGGDYKHPDDSKGTAAFVHAGTVTVPRTPPHGYRSAVAWDEASKNWIAVGPNGTDVSTDDGNNWRALLPTKGDAPDADRNWNALSLPYVVGPDGRIGKLKR
jgi:photosystem II stability/assembly factor-like uncharacterized protein